MPENQHYQNIYRVFVESLSRPVLQLKLLQAFKRFEDVILYALYLMLMVTGSVNVLHHIHRLIPYRNVHKQSKAMKYQCNCYIPDQYIDIVEQDE